MSGFIVRTADACAGEMTETEDKVFDSEQGAEDYARERGGAFAEGGEVLSPAGRDCIPKENADFVAEETGDCGQPLHLTGKDGKNEKNIVVADCVLPDFIHRRLRKQ